MLINSLLSNFVSSIKVPEFFSLNTRKDKIVAIALFSFSCIALLFLIKRCCCQIQAVPVDKEIKTEHEGEVDEDSNVLDENESDRSLEAPPLPDYPVDGEEPPNEEDYITPSPRTTTPFKRTPNRETPSKATPIKAIRKEQHEADIEKVETEQDPFNSAANPKPRTLKVRFGNLQGEIEKGRSFFDFTEEELEGVSPYEMVALRAREFAKNNPQRCEEPAENEDTAAVEDDEWDYIPPNQSSESQPLMIKSEPLNPDVHPQEVSLY